MSLGSYEFGTPEYNSIEVTPADVERARADLAAGAAREKKAGIVGIDTLGQRILNTEGALEAYVRATKHIERHEQ